MRRRSFLQVMGLTPVAVALPLPALDKLPARVAEARFYKVPYQDVVGYRISWTGLGGTRRYHDLRLYQASAYSPRQVEDILRRVAEHEMRQHLA